MKHLITAPNTWKSQDAILEYIQDKGYIFHSVQLFLPKDYENLNPNLNPEYDLGSRLKESFQKKDKDIKIILSNHLGGLSTMEGLGIRWFGNVPERIINGMVLAHNEHQPTLVIAPNYLEKSLQERLDLTAEIFVNPYCSPGKRVFKHRQ